MKEINVLLNKFMIKGSLISIPNVILIKIEYS